MTGDVAACAGKKQFPTFWAAQRAAKRLNKFNEGAKGNAYKCLGTHHFHIGNTLKKHKSGKPNRHSLRGVELYGRGKFSRKSR